MFPVFCIRTRAREGTKNDRTDHGPWGCHALGVYLCICTPHSPDEYPFTNLSELPSPILKPFPHPPILYPNKVNVNASILSFYTQAIVPRITRPATLALAALKRANGITGDDEYEDDGNYGSAAFVDLEVLQAISKRVHYGTPRVPFHLWRHTG